MGQSLGPHVPWASPHKPPADTSIRRWQNKEKSFQILQRSQGSVEQTGYPKKKSKSYSAQLLTAAERCNKIFTTSPQSSLHDLQRI